MDNTQKKYKGNIKKTTTNSEQLVISTANILDQINVSSELENAKQKILERKEKITKQDR